MKFISLALLICLIVSCKKDSKPKEASRTEMLSTTAWKYDNGGVDQDRNGTVDVSFESTGQIKPCILDNTVSFHSGGTGIADEGSTKCDPALPQTVPFSWSFADNETSIHIAGGGLFGFGGDFKVLELTNTTLGLAKDSTLTISGFPLAVTFIVHLKH